MAQEPHANEILEFISQTLNCSHRVVANLMGVAPHTLSNNREKILSDLTPRTRNRLSALYTIAVVKLGSYRPEMIYELLNTHAFTDRKGLKDSVVSALQQDKYDIEMLEQIANMALVLYEEKRLKKLIELPNVKNLSA
jgi:hypothetical protein